jgi:hypothetical protein
MRSRAKYNKKVIISMTWSFFEFLSASSRSYFADWLGDLPAAARPIIESRIKYVKTMAKIERPQWARLDREGKGLIEIRVKGRDKVQYRPLACDGEDMTDHARGNNRIFLLGGAIEKDRKFQPAGIIQTTQDRKQQLILTNNFREYTC